MVLVNSIDNKAIQIVENSSGNVTELKPWTVENCMKPGTFIITPIEVWEDDLSLEYRIKDTRVSYLKEAIKRGDVCIEEIPFIPKAAQSELSCFPCRNCGRC